MKPSKNFFVIVLIIYAALFSMLMATGRWPVLHSYSQDISRSVGTLLIIFGAIAYGYSLVIMKKIDIPRSFINEPNKYILKTAELVVVCAAHAMFVSRALILNFSQLNKFSAVMTGITLSLFVCAIIRISFREEELIA